MIRVRVVDDHPMVRRCVRAMLDHAEGGVPPLHALVAAAACLGALTAVLLDWAADDAGQSLRERITAALDRLRPDGRA